MISKNKIANEIVNKVFDETKKITVANITGKGEITIASLFLALTAFFVAGYRNDSELTLELTSAFQRKIQPFVDKEGFDTYTKLYSDSYSLFRAKAIEYQYKTVDWGALLRTELETMLLKMLSAEVTEYTRGFMSAEINSLMDIACNTGMEKGFIPYSRTKDKNKNAKLFPRLVFLVLMGVAVYFFVIKPLQNRLFNESTVSFNSDNAVSDPFFEKYGMESDSDEMFFYIDADINDEFLDEYIEYVNGINDPTYKTIPRISVESTFISSVAYSPRYNILIVEIPDSGIYGYINVDEKTFRTFITSESLGRYLNTNIKQKYECVKYVE